MKKAVIYWSMLIVVLTVVAACTSTIPGTATAAREQIRVPSESTTTFSSTGSSTSSSRSTASSGATATSTATSTTDAAGSYPSTPQSIPATAGSRERGAIVEAVRLSEYVLVPTFAFKDLTHAAQLSTLVLKSPAALNILLLDPVPDTAAKNGMIACFSSARNTEDNKKALINAALIFPSAESATAAAAALNIDIGATAADGGTEVPGFAGTFAATAASATGHSADVFLARGSLVLYVWANDEAGDATSLTASIGTMLTAEAPVSAKFVPTPGEKLADLPRDRDGMLAHTVPEADSISINQNQVYGIAGFKHFFINPLDDEAIITSAGVDLVTYGRSNVYRARDKAGAQSIQPQFFAEYKVFDPGATEVAGPSDVPGVQCLKLAVFATTVCVFTRGRYLVEANSTVGQGDVDALIRAQYAMLDGF